jgi:hypothetical protein
MVTRVRGVGVEMLFTAWTLLDLSAGLWGELFGSETGFRRHQIGALRQHRV